MCKRREREKGVEGNALRAAQEQINAHWGRNRRQKKASKRLLLGLIETELGTGSSWVSDSGDAGAASTSGGRAKRGLTAAAVASRWRRQLQPQVDALGGRDLREERTGRRLGKASGLSRGEQLQR